jgi:hypothetical protein
MHLKEVCRTGPVVLLAAAFCSLPDTAFGQAWAPKKGEGSVNFAFQRISNLGHRLTDGSLVPGTSPFGNLQRGNFRVYRDMRDFEEEPTIAVSGFSVKTGNPSRKLRYRNGRFQWS